MPERLRVRGSETPAPLHRRRVLAAAVVLLLVLLVGGSRIVLERGTREGGWLNESRLDMQLRAPPRFAWRIVAGKHWQVATDDARESEPTAVTDAREATRRGCPAGMVHARGRYKLDLSGRESSAEVEEMQNTTCTEWSGREFPGRCFSFDRDRWMPLAATLPTKPVDVCIDRFEYPNVLGAYPVVVVSYGEASALCAQGQKRLCTETEWTFACEGDDATPFPQGYARGGPACVVDASWKQVSEGVFASRLGSAARSELDRLWQGERSGARPGCRSPFGAYDMTGNVDEWTRSVRPGERPSIMKGGYWGPVRARCRPSTRAHGDEYVNYQQGLRCCADVPDALDPVGASGPAAAASTASAAPDPDVVAAPGATCAAATGAGASPGMVAVAFAAALASCVSRRRRGSAWRRTRSPTSSLGARS